MINFLWYGVTHTNTHTCVCVCSWAAVLHLSMFDQIIKTHFVYMISLGSFQVRLELVDEFTKIVLSAFEPFIGHHQGLFASVKIVLIYI